MERLLAALGTRGALDTFGPGHNEFSLQENAD